MLGGIRLDQHARDTHQLEAIEGRALRTGCRRRIR